MRFLQFLVRVFGWLLTPLVASAASFFGAILGAVLARRLADPVQGLLLSAGSALIAAMLVTALWLRILRRSPEVREALGVDASGVPETFVPPEVLGHAHDKPVIPEQQENRPA